MKINNKTLLYIYVVFLFVLTFLLASRVFKGIKTQDFDYLKIAINSVILIYVAFQVVRLGKIENDKTE
jgi:hypothetical protein